MSPANIEAALKSGSPLIGQAFSIGDERPYNTALIVLDADFAPQWAKRNGLEDRSLEELATDPKMIEAVQAGVDAANEHLARVEQIKRFKIVPGDWAPGGDELTPTMKLKRKPIAQQVLSRDRGDVRRELLAAAARDPPAIERHTSSIGWWIGSGCPSSRRCRSSCAAQPGLPAAIASAPVSIRLRALRAPSSAAASGWSRL